MGINWLPIENSFPNFLDSESPQAQIKKLHDYMYKLTQQLKYSLANLDTSNWNAAALERFSEDTAAGLVEEVKSFAQQLTRVEATAATLSSRIGAVANRVTDTETEITYLQERLSAVEDDALQLKETIALLQKKTAEHDETIAAMDESITQLQADQDDQEQRIAEVEEIIKPGEDSDTVGSTGRVLNLLGDIYVNGVLLNLGGTDNETA